MPKAIEHTRLTRQRAGEYDGKREYLSFRTDGTVKWKLEGQRWWKSNNQADYKKSSVSARAMYIASLIVDDKWQPL